MTLTTINTPFFFSFYKFCIKHSDTDIFIKIKKRYNKKSILLQMKDTFPTGYCIDIFIRNKTDNFVLQSIHSDLFFYRIQFR